jgi:hypothetical protein
MSNATNPSMEQPCQCEQQNMFNKYKTIVHQVFKVIKQVTNAILQVFRLLESDER